MRLFIAITVPDEVKRTIDKLRSALLAETGKKNVRMGGSGVEHITLAFLGNVPDGRVKDIAGSIQHHLTGLRKFKITSDGIVTFPNAYDFRVIALSVKMPDEVMMFRKKVAEELKLLGLMNDNKPFRPHLTLARVKDGRSVNPLVISKLVVEHFSLVIDKVHLFESKLSSDGAQHILIKSFDLK